MVLARGAAAHLGFGTHARRAKNPVSLKIRLEEKCRSLYNEDGAALFFAGWESVPSAGRFRRTMGWRGIGKWQT